MASRIFVFSLGYNPMLLYLFCSQVVPALTIGSFSVGSYYYYYYCYYYYY